MAERLTRSHLRRLQAKAAVLALRGQLTDELLRELANTRRDLAALSRGTPWDA